MGPTGAVGPTGMPGAEGGTPFYVTQLQSRPLQYGDMDNVLEVFQQRLVAPENGVFLVRLYFSGTVTKRADGASCLVQVSVRKDQDPLPILTQNVGILDGPIGQRLEVSVGGTLAARMDVTAAQSTLFRFEIRKADADCAPAGAGGATQIAQIFGQLEVQYFRRELSTQ